MTATSSNTTNSNTQPQHHKKKVAGMQITRHGLPRDPNTTTATHCWSDRKEHKVDECALPFSPVHQITIGLLDRVHSKLSAVRVAHTHFSFQVALQGIAAHRQTVPIHGQSMLGLGAHILRCLLSISSCRQSLSRPLLGESTDNPSLKRRIWTTSPVLVVVRTGLSRYHVQNFRSRPSAIVAISPFSISLLQEDIVEEPGKMTRALPSFRTLRTRRLPVSTSPTCAASTSRVHCSSPKQLQ